MTQNKIEQLILTLTDKQIKILYAGLSREVNCDEVVPEKGIAVRTMFLNRPKKINPRKFYVFLRVLCSEIRRLDNGSEDGLIVGSDADKRIIGNGTPYPVRVNFVDKMKVRLAMVAPPEK